jgi:hypothetical protein
LNLEASKPEFFGYVHNQNRVTKYLISFFPLKKL